MRERKSHIFELQDEEHYVEPRWVSRRLFEVESFSEVHDPCCGFGNFVRSARDLGIKATGSDIIDRGARGFTGKADFMASTIRRKNIAGNPPFGIIREFTLHALSLTDGKVAFVFPIQRLNAAGEWMEGTPLRTIYLLTPRPSMPPGEVYAALQADGKEGSGGTKDFAILVWEQGHIGDPVTKWLHRDKGKTS